jgi:hypothetical protein
VTACDITHVPLADNTLDVAVFSLALMGSNFTDYLREGHRTLTLDGQLHLIEPTKRFHQRDQFVNELATLGFKIISVEDRWKFTHIWALKTASQPAAIVLHF